MLSYVCNTSPLKNNSMCVFKVQRKYRFLKNPVGPGVKHSFSERPRYLATHNHSTSTVSLSLLTHHLVKPSELGLLLLQ